MPKATYTALSGATVVVEGTENEIAGVMRLLESDGGRLERLHLDLPSSNPKQNRSTPMGLLSDLIARGFFSRPQDLGAVRLALEEQGHFYPTTTLSPLMLRLVRRRELRRIKEQSRWLYVR